MAFAVFWAGAAFATSVIDLSAPNRRILEQAISRAAESERSGTWLSWQGSEDLHGSISPGPAFSQATHQACTGCNDPCRAVTYTVENGAGTARYAGEWCRTIDHSGNSLPVSVWRTTGGDRLISYTPFQTAEKLPPPSVVQPRLPHIQPTQPALSQPDTGEAPALAVRVTRIQEGLKALLYYYGVVDGDFGPSTKQAVTTFLSDENSSLPANPSAEVLKLVETADSRAHAGTCPSAGANSDVNLSYVACATLAP